MFIFTSSSVTVLPRWRKTTRSVFFQNRRVLLYTGKAKVRYLKLVKLGQTNILQLVSSKLNAQLQDVDVYRLSIWTLWAFTQPFRPVIYLLSCFAWNQKSKNPVRNYPPCIKPECYLFIYLLLPIECSMVYIMCMYESCYFVVHILRRPIYVKLLGLSFYYHCIFLYNMNLKFDVAEKALRLAPLK